MSGELDLINQSAERLFADHVDAELHDAVAAGSGQRNFGMQSQRSVLSVQR